MPVIDIKLLKDEGHVQTKDQDNYYKLFAADQRADLEAYLAAGGISAGAIAGIVAEMGWS